MYETILIISNKSKK